MREAGSRGEFSPESREIPGEAAGDPINVAAEASRILALRIPMLAPSRRQNGARIGGAALFLFGALIGGAVAALLMAILR